MVAKDMAGGVAVVVVLMRLNLRIYLPMWWRWVWRWVKRSKCPSWIRLNLDSNSSSLRFSEWALPLRLRML